MPDLTIAIIGVVLVLAIGLYTHLEHSIAEDARLAEQTAAWNRLPTSLTFTPETVLETRGPHEVLVNTRLPNGWPFVVIRTPRDGTSVYTVAYGAFRETAKKTYVSFYPYVETVPGGRPFTLTVPGMEYVRPRRDLPRKPFDLRVMTHPEATPESPELTMKLTQLGEVCELEDVLSRALQWAAGHTATHDKAVEKKRLENEAKREQDAREVRLRAYEEQSKVREALEAEEAIQDGGVHLKGVLARWKTGSQERRKLIAASYDRMIENHLDPVFSKIDFHTLPFEGRLMYLGVFLDHKVGGGFPRYDFERSNPIAGEYVYISHHGPADEERWREDLPLVDRYLGGRWNAETLDATSIVLSKRPELPAIIPFERKMLRKGEVLFGFDQLTAEPYYVPLTKLTHVLVGGQSGVGKSVLLNQCLRSLAYNLDLIDELVLVDLKGGVELSRYKHLSPKIRFIKHYDELPELAESLVATMYQRLDELEQRGELAVKSGFRIVIIDEFAAIQQRTFKGKEEKERHQALIANLNLLSQQARAAGIKLWAQLQKPTADNMDTNFRTNLQSVLCFFMPSKLNAASMFGELDGLPADPTKLGKGEFVFRDDAQNRTVLLKAAYCDEHDIEGLKACVHPDHRTPEHLPEEAA